MRSGRRWPSGLTCLLPWTTSRRCIFWQCSVARIPPASWPHRHELEVAVLVSTYQLPSFLAQRALSPILMPHILENIRSHFP